MILRYKGVDRMAYFMAASSSKSPSILLTMLPDEEVDQAVAAESCGFDAADGAEMMM